MFGPRCPRWRGRLTSSTIDEQPPPKPSRRGWLVAVNVGFLGIGIVALVWLVRRVGPSEILASIVDIGGWAFVLLASSAVSVVLNAAAIHTFMRPEQRMVSFWRVLAAQLSGQAVNSVTPTGTLGEVAKATLLVGHVPRYRAVSSVVSFNVALLLVKCVLLLIALAVSLLALDLPSRVDWLLRVSFLIVAAATSGALFVMHRGLVRTFADVSRRLGLLSTPRHERLSSRLANLDRQLRLIGANRDDGRALGIVFIALAQALAIFDLGLILYAIGAPQAIPVVFIAAVASSFIGMLASVVPLGIGANEGGLAGLFQVLGPGAMVGLSVSLIARIRTVIVAAIGLVVMLAVQLADHIGQRLRVGRLERRRRLRENG